MTDWDKPRPVEQKQITDAITELQAAESVLKETPVKDTCSAHGPLVRMSLANTTGQILNLRMTEQIMWKLENGNNKAQSDSFLGSLSFGKLNARGLSAVVLSVVVALTVVYGVVEYMKMQTRDVVAEALTQTMVKQGQE